MNPDSVLLFALLACLLGIVGWVSYYMELRNHQRSIEHWGDTIDALQQSIVVMEQLIERGVVSRDEVFLIPPRTKTGRRTIP